MWQVKNSNENYTPHLVPNYRYLVWPMD